MSVLACHSTACLLGVHWVANSDMSFNLTSSTDLQKPLHTRDDCVQYMWPARMQHVAGSCGTQVIGWSLCPLSPALATAIITLHVTKIYKLRQQVEQ